MGQRKCDRHEGFKFVD